MDAIHQFIHMYGQEMNSRVVFYFAGHGHTLRLAYGGDMGYIVPRDAPDPNKDKLEFLKKAIDMQQFEVFAKRIQSKHAIFIFDSCFSGSIFSLDRAIPEHINYKTARPVRQFITAGSADETVPDESIFRIQFSAALNGEADVDRDGFVTGVELGEFLQKTVVNYTNGYQHPQYGKIRDRNLDKGDFVFPMLQASLAPAKSVVLQQPGSSRSAPVPEAPAPVILRGHLQINVNAPSALVMFNGDYQGMTKLGQPLNLVNVPTGKATVHLEAEGYEPLDQTVTISLNKWTQGVFELRKTPEAKDMCWNAALGKLSPC